MLTAVEVVLNHAFDVGRKCTRLADRVGIFSSQAWSALVLAVLLLAAQPVLAQQRKSEDGPKLQFSHLRVADGLSHSDVRAIVQDKQGFMWFATFLGGLNRYDGYTFKVYKNDLGNAQSLAADSIWTLHVDRGGNLWVGIVGGGLDRYDQNTDSFVHYRHRKNDPSSLPDDAVRALYEDDEGTLWVGTKSGGLSRFDPSSNSFFTYRADPKDAQRFGSPNVVALHVDKNTGLLWVGTVDDGVSVIERATGRVVARYTHIAQDPTSLSHNVVTSISQDRSGTLWLSTQGGLNRFDPYTSRFTRYVHDAKDSRSLSDNYVVKAYEDRLGRFWVATNHGLNLMDREKGTFVHYRNDATDPTSLGSDIINYGALYEDTSGALWLGMRSTGVDRLGAEVKKFTTYNHKAQDADSLGGNAVMGLAVGSKGELWIGTESSLDRFDGQNFKRYENDPRNPTSLNPGPQRMVVQDSSGAVWSGTYGGGLSRLDGDHFTHFRHDPKNPDSPANDNISSLVPDSKGGLWIGVHGKGLDYFDGRHFTHFPPNVQAPFGLPDAYVMPTLLDEHGMLWITTVGWGLVRLDTATGKFTSYLIDPSRPGSQAANWVQDIYWDGRVMWGASPVGLFAFDPVKAVFTRHYTEKDGLASNSVVSVQGDTQGNVWMGTVKGLSRLNPKTGVFRNFDVFDGLQSNEFSRVSRVRASDGRLFFGGVNGFNAFYPEQLPDNPNPPKVVLTEFSLFNQPVEVGGLGSPLQQALQAVQAMTLRYDQSVIRFAFAALDYVSPQKNQYAYMLEGFDQDWVHTDAALRSATYTNLDPGEYVFRVKASNNDGIWNEHGASLKITVTPPWWGTWWFKVLMVTMVLALLYGIYRFRIKSLKNYSEKLAHDVKQRTRALAESNQQLYAAKDAAELAGVTLRENFDRITELNGHLAQQAQALMASQQQLAQTEAWYRSVLQSAPDGMLVMDSEGIIVQTNAQLATQFGYEEQALLGKHVALLLPDMLLEKHVNHSMAFNLHLSASRKDGSVFPVDISLARLPDEAGKVGSICAAIRDVTELRAIEERLRQSRDVVRALVAHKESEYQKERKELAYQIHEDLAQNLAALRMQIVSMGQIQKTGEPLHDLKALDEIIRRCIVRIRDIVTVLRPTVLDLGLVPALEWLIDDFKGIGLRFDVVMQEDVPLSDEVATVLFRAAQEALLNVALHAGATHVRVELERLANSCCLVVHDNGCGFDPHEPRKNCFGLLGLSEQVLHMGGEVSIDSQPGQGTTLKIQLPAPLLTDAIA